MHWPNGDLEPFRRAKRAPSSRNVFSSPKAFFLLSKHENSKNSDIEMRRPWKNARSNRRQQDLREQSVEIVLAGEVSLPRNHCDDARSS